MEGMKMKHKRGWTGLLAGAVCLAMILAAPVVSFAEGNDDGTDIVQEDAGTKISDAQKQDEAGETGLKDQQEAGEYRMEEKTEKDTDPQAITTQIKTNFTEDITVNFKNGTNGLKIKSIDSVSIGIDGADKNSKTFTSGYQYDLETGELTVSSATLRAAMARGIGFYTDEEGLPYCYVGVHYTTENGQNRYTYRTMEEWILHYTGSSLEDESAPQFINGSYEFDGTQDLVFKFQNGTGNHEIKAIKEIGFLLKEKNGTAEDGTYLDFFHIGNYGTSYTCDLEKGEVTIFRHAVAALVYDQLYSISNVYGDAYMAVEFADGRTEVLYAGESSADWTIKILARSEESDDQHVVEIPDEQTSISKDDMQNLVDINKNADVIIKTASGVYYSFAKGTMHMVSGKDVYEVGVELITDFSQLAAMSRSTLPFTEEEFAFRINYNYSGELPGTAQITIPLDTKWAGQTLYYYEVMPDNTYRYTGQSAVVADNGTYTITQDHCSDYAGLTKLLEGSEDDAGNNAGADNNSSGNNSNSGDITTTDNQRAVRAL